MTGPGRHHRRAAAARFRAAEVAARHHRRAAGDARRLERHALQHAQAAVRRHQLPQGGRLRRSTATASRRTCSSAWCIPPPCRLRPEAGGMTRRPTTSSATIRQGARVSSPSRNTRTAREFDVSVPATPYLLDMQDAAVVVQAQLQQLGITPNIKLLEPNVVVAQYIRGEQQCTMANIMSPGEATYLIMVNFMAGQVMTRTSNYSNPRIDKLMTQILRRDRPGKAEAALQRADDDLRRGAAVHLVRLLRRRPNVWRDSVKNFKVQPGTLADGSGHRADSQDPADAPADPAPGRVSRCSPCCWSA